MKNTLWQSIDSEKGSDENVKKVGTFSVLSATLYIAKIQQHQQRCNNEKRATQR